jgi:DNA-binding CsgD family transcriptional regulator
MALAATCTYPQARSMPSPRPERLQLLARLLAAAEELAGMGSWELDLVSGQTLWSDGMYRVLGLPLADRRHTEAEILRQVHPEDRERIGRLLADVVARPHAVPREGLQLDLRMVRGDGSARELRAIGRVERDDDGQPARWIGSVQDITEQRLSERELRAHYGVSQALREWESFEFGVVDLLRRIATALEYPMASLWLWDAGAEALACRAFWTAPGLDAGEFERSKRAISFRPGEGKPGLAWLTREPVVTPDVATDLTFRPRDAATARGIASAVAFPAVGPDGPVAVLSFYSCEPRAPSAELVRTLTAIGRELGRFLSRRRAQLGPQPLSDREMQVLRLAAAGVSGPDIAVHLRISPATIKTHVEHIYEKLGVGDRVAAVAQALRTGLIS